MYKKYETIITWFSDHYSKLILLWICGFYSDLWQNLSAYFYVLNTLPASDLIVILQQKNCGVSTNGYRQERIKLMRNYIDARLQLPPILSKFNNISSNNIKLNNRIC